MKINNKGFSLLELLLYMAILSVVGAVTTGILTNVVRINVQETAGNEVTSQLNSVMQIINSLVRQSSNIEIATSTAVTTLKLRMNDKTKDPTCVYIASSTIKLSQGPDATNPQNCTSATSDLTTSKVTADSLTFQKITYYPGHDTVTIDIQLSFNTTNPQASSTRLLHTAIARVSAATFDDNLVPGSSNAYDIGLSGSLWKSINNLIYFSGSNTGIGTTGPLSKLDVNGGVAIGAYAGNNAAPTNGLIVSGNVGIGTTGPGQKLTVSPNSAMTFTLGGLPNPVMSVGAYGANPSDGVGLFVHDTVTGYAGWTGAIRSGNENCGTWGCKTLRLQVPDNAGNIINALSISGVSGYVGIGTTTPAYKLDVSGQINASTGLCMGGSCKTSWSDLAGPWTTSDNNIYNNNSGYVGIGTSTPSSILSIGNGGITIDGTLQQGIWQSRVPKNNVKTSNIGGNARYGSMQPSITIGADGLPIIAYSDYGNPGYSFKVAKCGNISCSSGNTVTTIETANYRGSGVIAIAGDGLPVAVYMDHGVAPQKYRFVHCGNAACSSGNTLTTMDYGVNLSMTIGTDGYPVIAYSVPSSASNVGDIVVTKCGNFSCTSGNTSSTVDSSLTGAVQVAITIGSDGYPVIEYYGETSPYPLKVAKCGNASCSSGNTITTVDSAGGFVTPSSITIGPDGLPVIAYESTVSPYTLKVLKCGNTACSSGNTATTLSSDTSTSGFAWSITISPDGLPVVLYSNIVTGYLKVAKCGNASCSSSAAVTSTSTVDTTANNYFGDMAIGVDGLPIIAVQRSTQYQIDAIHCGSINCIPYWTRR